MRNSISKYKIKRIQRLYSENLSISGISKLVNVSKNTVYKYTGCKSHGIYDKGEFRRGRTLPKFLKERIEIEKKNNREIKNQPKPLNKKTNIDI